MSIARRSFKVEVPSVAMGDIAFNLLIFFVILARAQDDSHLKWNPAAAIKVEAIEHAKVRVVVDIEHKLHFNGREIGVDNLAAAVEEALGDLPAGQRAVLLKIDKDVPATTFEPIIEAVSEAGGELMHVLAEKKPEP